MKRFLTLITLALFAANATSQIINPLAEKDTILTADDLDMRSTPTETTAICTGNVVLKGTNMKISCDRLEIIASRIGDRNATIGEFKGFKSLIATGNVRLVQGDREATCGRAEVLPLEEKVVLSLDPVVIDRSSDFIAAGSRITLFRGERQLRIENAKLTAPPIKDLGVGVEDAIDDSAAAPSH